MDRARKRNSLLLCVAADGSSLKRLLILLGKTIEEELSDQGINEESGRIANREHRFITTVLLQEYWGCQILFLELRQRRKRYRD
jgi:hypothetical protein